LTSGFELIADSSERGNGRSYFLREVIWAPASTTRTLRVHYDLNGVVTQIKLCVSSDNNNSVFIPPPFNGEKLRAVIAEEIALLTSEDRFG
jgi:hypothetical protein